jgi:hypothetical protein
MVRWCWAALAAMALLGMMQAATAQDPRSPRGSTRSQRGKPADAPRVKPVTRPQGGKLDLGAFSERFTETKIWKLREEFKSQGPAGTFEKLDANSDGFVDGTELRQLHQYLDTTPSQPSRIDSSAMPTSFISGSKHRQDEREPLDMQVRS